MEEKFINQAIHGCKRYLACRMCFIKYGLVFLAMLLCGQTNGQYQWDGENTYGNFSYSNNWYSNTQPSWGSGNDLEFRDNKQSQTSTYFDYGAWKDLRSIFYYGTYLYDNNDASKRGLITLDYDNSKDQGINFYWKIENQSSDTQRLRIPLSFKGTDLQINPVNANLIIDNNLPIYNDNHHDYNVWGDNGNKLILGNRPNGDANTKIIINQYSIVEIANDMNSHSECFGGGVEIKTGELWFDAGSSIKGGTILVGGDSKTAKIFLNDGDGGLDINNNITVPNSSPDSHIGGLNASGTNTYSGIVTLNASAFLECWGGGSVNFTGDITGGNNVVIQRVYGTGTGTVQYSGTAKTCTGSTTIKSDAALRISSNQSLGNISLESGGVLIVDNGVTLIITGSWSGGGTIINNGTIVLQGPGAFPGNTTTVSAMNILSLNKTGTTNLDKNLSIAGTFNLVNGILNIGSNNLTLEGTALIGGNTPGAGNMIQADGMGKVVKNFSAPGAFTFPIGDNTSGADYSPASITINSLTGTPSVSINIADVKHPNNTSPTNFISRYWNVTSSGTLNADANFTYTNGDINGSETSLITAGYDGTNWSLYGNASATTNTLSLISQTNFSRAFTAGDQFTPLASLPGDYFRSRQTGSWNEPGNWESSFDGVSNWTTSTLVPDQNAAGITIRNTHTITLIANATAKMLKIESGGTLDNTNTSGGFALTIDDDGTAASDFDIFGTYILYGKQPSLASNAIVTVYNGGIVRANNNFSPVESDDFARDAQVNWLTGALFDWNTTNVFETSGEIYFPNAGATDIAIFRISQTVTVGGSGDTHFNGLVQVNANSTFDGGGKKIFRNGICGNATLTQDGSINNPGNFQITGNNAILGGNNLTLNLTDILNINTNVEVPVDSIVTVIKSSGNATSGSISKGLNVVLTANGTADMTTINMDNTSGSLDINGILRTASTDGLIGNSGATVTNGTINLNSGSTVEYYAVAAQKVSTTAQLGNKKYYNLILSGDNLKSPFNSNPIIIDDAGSLKITGPSTLIIDATTNNIGPNNTSNVTSFTMNGGRLKLGTLGFTGSGTLPSMKGTYSLTGGTIEFLGGTSSTNQSVRSGNSYQYFNIEVSGPYVSTSGGNVNIKDGGSFIVNNGGIFTINANSIAGVNTPSTASVRNKSGSIFRSGNTGGFNGRTPVGIGDTTSSIHGNITIIILEPGSTVNYYRDNTFAGDGSQPITNANGLQYQNLTVSGTGNKIAPSNTLVIKGDFSKTTASVFVHNSGTVEFNNSAIAQSYNSVAPYPVFFNLNNNNSKTLDANSPLSVKNLLSLKDNSKLNIDGDITLISDNAGTASIDKIPEGANPAYISYGSGSFIIERYIPNHPRAWQLLSVPTKGSTIFESWQNSKSSTLLRGTNITDNRTDWSANGFDKKSYSPSMKYYVPASDSYAGVDKTSDRIDLHSGYFLFVRGDRSATDIGSPSTEVTLHTKGRIYASTPSGEAPLTINVPANSFMLIGNPYASPINFDDLTKSSNIQVDYYIWDPQLTTTPSVYGLGAFRAISGNSASPPGGNYVDGAIPPIQSGQAFFVFNPSATAGTVAFSESAKTTGSKSIFRNTRNIPAPSAKISVNLYLNVGNTSTLLDGITQLFNKSYSDKIDVFDAKKMMNGTENIFLPTNIYPLSIERKTLPKVTDTTFLNLTGLNKRNYLIHIKIADLESSGVKVVLNDLYTFGQYPLQEGDNEYTFEGNDDNASRTPGRFFITYRNIPPPFAFRNENVITRSESVNLNWETISGDEVSNYSIEIGKDSTQFDILKSITADASAQYTWTHYPPSEGTHYYRITATLKNGSIVHSRILKSEIQFPPVSVTVFPNPATDHVTLKLTRKPAGKYRLQLIQADGKVIYSEYINHTISAVHKINLKGNAAGIYYLELTGPDKKNDRKKIILER